MFLLKLITTQFFIPIILLTNTLFPRQKVVDSFLFFMDPTPGAPMIVLTQLRVVLTSGRSVPVGVNVGSVT